MYSRSRPKRVAWERKSCKKINLVDGDLMTIRGCSAAPFQYARYLIYDRTYASLASPLPSLPNIHMLQF